MAINLCDIEIQTAVIIVSGAWDFVYALERSWGGWFDHICQSFHNGRQSVPGCVGQRVSTVRGNSVGHRYYVLVVIRVVSLTDHVLDGGGRESQR